MALKAGRKGFAELGPGLEYDEVLGKLSIDGSLGTEVEANPEGEASATLTKLKVESDIYDIPAQPDILGKADITAIAPNEPNATASQDYAAGEHFYKNGKFCTAKTDIARGATFTLNTNYVEGTVADFTKKWRKVHTSEAFALSTSFASVIKNVNYNIPADATELFYRVEWQQELTLNTDVITCYNQNIKPTDGIFFQYTDATTMIRQIFATVNVFDGQIKTCRIDGFWNSNVSFIFEIYIR